MTHISFEHKAERLLAECDALRAPVPIDNVVRHLDLLTQARPLAEVSGLLVVENGRGLIGYNASHSTVRQRFTIAHEIGHYVLHAKNKAQSLFVDKHVFRRDEGSSTGLDQQEVEANKFAAALLMPEALVRAEIAKQQLDLDDEDDVSNLARRFNVSAAAMSFRLKNLQLLRI